MNKFRNLCAALLGTALLTAPLPTRAQDFGMVMFSDSIDLTNAYVAQSAFASVAGGGTSAVTLSEPANLKFRIDQRISDQIREDFRRQLITANPSAETAINAALSKDWLRGYRDEIASPNDLDASNLADAYTAYLVSGWALVNAVDRPSNKGILAVRDALREAIAANPEVQHMSDADRQRSAESLIYNTVLIMANRVRIFKTGDSIMQRAASTHYHASFAALGIDLSNLTLTDRGFVSNGQ